MSASDDREAIAVDWEEVERSAEFQALVRSRRSFVVPATAFFLAWCSLYVLLAAYARDLMATQLVPGLTVGFALALSQVLMTWVITFLYLRKSDRELAPLERRAAERAGRPPGGGAR